MENEKTRKPWEETRKPWEETRKPWEEIDISNPQTWTKAVIVKGETLSVPVETAVFLLSVDNQQAA